MPILLIFLFAYTFSQFYRSFLAVVTAELTHDLGLGPAELGNLTAIWFVTFALSQFLVGYLLDRHGPRRTVSCMMLVAVAGAVLFSQASGYFTALLGMGLVGFGCSPILMGALYYFGRRSAPEKFPVYTSILVGFGNLGNLAGSRPLAQAVAAFGWRPSLLAIGAMTAIAALLVYLIVEDPPVAKVDGPRKNALEELWQIISFRPLWPVFLLNFVSYAVIAAERGLWIGPFLDRVYGFGALERGNAAFLMGVGMALGALAVGWLVPILGSARNVAVFGNLGTAAAFLCLGLIPGVGAGAAVALLAISGLFGMCYGVILSHARLFFPDHLLGKGVTFANFMSIGGAGIMLSGTGFLVRDAFDAGTPAVVTFAGLHLGFGVLLILSLLIYVRAPAKPHSPMA